MADSLVDNPRNVENDDATWLADGVGQAARASGIQVGDVNDGAASSPSRKLSRALRSRIGQGRRRGSGYRDAENTERREKPMKTGDQGEY